MTFFVFGDYIKKKFIKTVYIKLLILFLFFNFIINYLILLK